MLMVSSNQHHTLPMGPQFYELNQQDPKLLIPQPKPLLSSASVSLPGANLLNSTTSSSPKATPVVPITPIRTPNNSFNKITLPPISSFDNLVRAAEYNSGIQNVNGNNSNGFIASSIVQRSKSLPTLPGPIQPPLLLQHSPPESSHEDDDESTFSSSRVNSISSSSSNSTSSLNLAMSASSSINGVSTIAATNKKVKKQRKKKECPICHNFYANLSTHNSTHLTPENRPHKCPICNHGFARNNDLIRHKKRHWRDEFQSSAEESSSLSSSSSSSSSSSTESGSLDLTDKKYNQLKSLHNIKGTFKCPYNSTLIKLDMDIYPHKKGTPLKFESSNCHATGVFSRCDTYKNHLKALHFEYPPGTKKANRSIVPGKCKHCGKNFPNVDVWLKTHIERDCGYSYH
ncbi:hypothetical protein Kpol_337p6 [Vanderwaltozyma polyspora DSM 70294]|uniref:C2H2-type domain-containing protein n=1 Tax=Vanderwaltozyma polyspora (strain ATCC 22028 / DSM 70294 / BCRC 21397 / CBS 2163 / NBRC 10782 / NRRL Y-8283 / UCD 57-17) TaxID=436907 RepID=A7TT28_VANPO|nr:uncharacterized protein Kpol_337p6 [Vanderwaltozyma polyspora DSM 70294]EDO14584.1 hypothetical protein Kpol_337p6 [Vanderwaltozyma polyspora DSM 70294]